MKQYILVILLLCFMNDTARSQPLKLELRLTNCEPEFLYISFFENGSTLTDTIKKGKNGYYCLTTTRIKSPQVTLITSASVVVKDIFVAPGYNLVISGDAGTDFYTMNKNLHISGIGEKANNYNRMRDSLWEVRPIEGMSPYGKNLNVFLNSLTEMARLSDSLLNKYILLDSNNATHLYFAKLKKIDNRFDQMIYLLFFAKNFNSDPKFADQLLKDYAHFDTGKDLSDSLLLSPSFRSFIRVNYIDLFTRLDTIYGLYSKEKIFSRFDIANAIFTGKVRQYVLYSILEHILESISNIEDLVVLESGFKKRLDLVISNASKSELRDFYNLRELELGSFLVGKTSPVFNGTDLNGLLNNSKQFGSKVLYIDLWGTWCGACLLENKYLANLSKQYINNPKFAIISIAISDNLSSWKSFLRNQVYGANWLQWFDSNAKTRGLFNGTLALPKFILVDKDGKISDFNAPPPSEMSQLKGILDRLLK